VANLDAASFAKDVAEANHKLVTPMRQGQVPVVTLAVRRWSHCPPPDATSQCDVGATRALLDQSLKLHPEFIWLGLAATDMSVITAVGDSRVVARALQAPSPHTIVAGQATYRPGVGLLPAANAGADAAAGPSLIELAVQVHDQSGSIIGVAIAVWDWSQAIMSSVTPGHLGLEHTDALILSAEGRVLLGSANQLEDMTGASS
jgi:hypothetical protein